MTKKRTVLGVVRAELSGADQLRALGTALTLVGQVHVPGMGEPGGFAPAPPYADSRLMRVKQRHKLVLLDREDLEGTERRLNALADDGWCVRYVGPDVVIMVYEIWPDARQGTLLGPVLAPVD